MSSLDLKLKIIPEQGICKTSAYRKPIFSTLYTHFDSFLLPNYKTGTVQNEKVC